MKPYDSENRILQERLILTQENRIQKLEKEILEYKRLCSEWAETIDDILVERDFYKNYAAKELEQLRNDVERLNTLNRTYVSAHLQISEKIDDLVAERDFYKEKCDELCGTKQRDPSDLGHH